MGGLGGIPLRVHCGFGVLRWGLRVQGFGFCRVWDSFGLTVFRLPRVSEFIGRYGFGFAGG